MELVQAQGHEAFVGVACPLRSRGPSRPGGGPGGCTMAGSWSLSGAVGALSPWKGLCRGLQDGPSGHSLVWAQRRVRRPRICPPEQGRVPRGGRAGSDWPGRRKRKSWSIQVCPWGDEGVLGRVAGLTLEVAGWRGALGTQLHSPLLKVSVRGWEARPSTPQRCKARPPGQPQAALAHPRLVFCSRTGFWQ